MPIIRGFHVPEIDNIRVRPKEFNALLLDIDYSILSTISIYIEMLHDYLETLNLSEHKIIIHVISPDNSTFHNLALMNDSLKVHDIILGSNDSIIELAKELNVDIILDSNKKFTSKEVNKNSSELVIVNDINNDFYNLLNAICAGWNVPWNFRDPVWNASWITKYLEPNSVARKVFDFMDLSRSKNYTDEQRNIIRNLSNKISQVNHSKQTLDYILILRRYIKRHDLKSEDVLFELSYHLNNYYLLVSGSLDILARLINDVYQLGFQPHDSYTLDKTTFLDKLKLKRKGLVGIIQLVKFLDWMDWMKQRRNLLAHQSHLYLTPLIQRKKVQLSDAELDAAVEASTDWAQYASVAMNQQVIDSMKEFKKFQIDLEENHETIVEDIMTMSKRDRKTRVTGNVVFFPLKAINEDYTNMNEIINRVVDNLMKARPI